MNIDSSYLKTFVPEQAVYVLEDYNFVERTVVSVGRARLKVKHEVMNGNTGQLYDYFTTPPLEKCAHPTDLVVVVWEMWRGVNGRGGHRIEREMYPEHRIAAQHIGRQRGPGRVTEDKHGSLVPNIGER